MNDNFNNALAHAKNLLEDGRNIKKIIDRIAEEYRLTIYEIEELTKELHLL